MMRWLIPLFLLITLGGCRIGYAHPPDDEWEVGGFEADPVTTREDDDWTVPISTGDGGLADAETGSTIGPSEPLIDRSWCNTSPVGPALFPGTVRFETADSSCREGAQADGTPACLIVGDTVRFEEAGYLRVTGDRPIIFVATTGDIEVDGTIDVGSRLGDSFAGIGAGALQVGPAMGEAGFAGGGGGHALAGGAGGGVGGGGGGMASGSDNLVPLTGGGGGGGGLLRSAGGGAVGLVACRGAVRIGATGRILASGSGGLGGLGGAGADPTGGQGGGAGGAILIDADTLIVAEGAELLARGGGGGGGGSSTGLGVPGDHGDSADEPLGGAGAVGSGHGGQGGGDRAPDDGQQGISGADSAGGGGGGAGRIRFNIDIPILDGRVIPAATVAERGIVL